MTQSFPPPGFVPARSALSGVELWAPAPPEVEHREVVTFRCPRCGAGTAYSVANGGLTCAHCGYYEPPAHQLLGTAAQDFEFTVETLTRAARGWGTARKQLECELCGAYTSVSPEQLTNACPFCGSQRVIQREAPQDELRPRALIPFTLDPAGCQARFHAWIGNTWMVPKELQRLAAAPRFTPIYIPFWTFDSTTEARWRAEVGHVRGSGKRRRVVWRWENGTVRRTFDDLLTSGTRRISLLLMGQVHEYDLEQLVAYDPKYLAGIQAQAYDIMLDDAWASARLLMREQVRAECATQPSTQRVRNFQMELDYADERWRYILTPLYVAVYQYAGQTYQVLVNGQTGAVAGQRPVDWLRVGAALAALIVPGLVLGVLAIQVLRGAIGAGLSEEQQFIALIVALALGAAGVVAAFMILSRALALDDA